MWYLEPWSSSFSLLCVLGGEDRLCYQVSLNAVLSFANLSFHLSLIFNRPLSDIGGNCVHRTAFIMLYCYVHFTRSCELKQRLVSADMINIRMGSLNGLTMPNEPTEPGWLVKLSGPVSTVKQIGWVCNRVGWLVKLSKLVGPKDSFLFDSL